MEVSTKGKGCFLFIQENKQVWQIIVERDLPFMFTATVPQSNFHAPCYCFNQGVVYALRALVACCTHIVFEEMVLATQAAASLINENTCLILMASS